MSLIMALIGFYALTQSNMEAMASGTKPIHFPMALNKTIEVALKTCPNFVMSFRF